MEQTLELDVATMFRDATMQSVVLELRTPADWDHFNEVDQTAKQREMDEVQDYTNNKDQRLTDARKELIDKAGALTHEHPTPFGTDRFNKSDIDRQAKIKVENDHQTCLLGILQDEAEAYSELTGDIRAREGLRDHARDDFNITTDRRDGADRRMPTRTR